MGSECRKKTGGEEPGDRPEPRRGGAPAPHRPIRAAPVKEVLPPAAQGARDAQAQVAKRPPRAETAAEGAPRRVATRALAAVPSPVRAAPGPQAVGARAG